MFTLPVSPTLTRFNQGITLLGSLLVLILAGCTSTTSQTGANLPCAPTFTPSATRITAINVTNFSIAVGPDGAIWAQKTMPPDYHYELHRFSSASTDEVITPPFDARSVAGMTSGSDQNLWITTGDALIRRTAGGQYTTFALTTPSCYAKDASGSSFHLAQGSDGALWFTLYGDSRIGRITPQGAITEYALPVPFVHSFDLTAGPDGNVWFTDELGSNIGRITPQGQITAFPLGTPNDAPTGIAAGADGNLWFTEPGTGRLGKITPDGRITHYSLPIPNSLPIDIVQGPDGNLWFTELQANQIGRITPTGQIREFPTRAEHGQPNQMVVGSEGTLWFSSNGDVFRMKMDGTPLSLDNGQWNEMHS